MIRRSVRCHLTKTEADLSWEKVPAWLFWKNWSMRDREVRRFSQKLWDTVQPVYHITSPAEDGSGAAKAMELALEEAGVKKEELMYINAHGTATHHNDLFETRAIKKLFGEHAYEMKVNSTKSMVGHLLGAAGAVEFITCVKEIEDGFIHATAGYTTPDEEMDLNYVAGDGVEENLEYALSNSLGFGGHNASILVKKWDI